MPKERVKQKYITSTIKNLRAAGHSDATKENVFKKYPAFLKRFLELSKGFNELHDSALNELIKEVEENNYNKQ